MDSEEKEAKLETFEDRFLKVKSENDRLIYQLKKLEEENYAKSLQLTSQRQLIETLQEKVNESKGVKTNPAPKPDESQELQVKLKELTSRCLVLEQINEETVKKTKKDIEIWQNEAESARKQMRKLEEDLYNNKKLVAELQDFENKFKKEVTEKEKLVISLESTRKANTALEETIKNLHTQISDQKVALDDNTKDRKIQELTQQLTELRAKSTESDFEMQNFHQNFKSSQDSNQSLTKSLQSMQVDLKKSEELIQVLKRQITDKDHSLTLKDQEILKTQKESFDLLTRNMISFKIDLKVEEKIEVVNQEHEADLQELSKLKAENEKLKKHELAFEGFLESSVKEAIEIYKEKYSELEVRASGFRNKFKRSKEENNELKGKVRYYERVVEEQESSLNQMNQDMMSTKKQISILQEDCSSYNSVISQLNMEKTGLETMSKQKESKFKAMSSKLQFLEAQIQEKNKEILNRENELMSADRQIDILKKKISSSSSRIKQIATEQIDSQKKKLDSYESELKMLKEMLKSVQTELKHKHQELAKLKKPSPRKNPQFDESPLQNLKSKNQETEHKLLEVVKETPYKKQSVNIFKAKSPFRINSRKTLAQEEAPGILRHIVKGYLTSYVLCEKEKKEMMKVFIDADLARRGVLDKSFVTSKCEEAMFDSSLLGIYGKEVDYKDFVEMNYHNQLQQIHRDLEINFSQILPGTISISELKMMKQALRPLHRQIWEVIVDRIGSEYPKEVDMFVVKQVLSQAQISL